MLCPGVLIGLEAPFSTGRGGAWAGGSSSPSILILKGSESGLEREKMRHRTTYMNEREHRHNIRERERERPMIVTDKTHTHEKETKMRQKNRNETGTNESYG